MAVFGVIENGRIVSRLYVADDADPAVEAARAGRGTVRLIGDEQIGWVLDTDGETFSPPAAPRRLVPLAVVMARVLAFGLMDAAQAAFAMNAVLRDRFAELREGIYADDEDARSFLTAIGGDPDVILGP